MPGRDALPTTQSLRRGQAVRRVRPDSKGAPKRSDGGPLIRRNLGKACIRRITDERELIAADFEY